jgi:CRISPR-associated protein Cas1
MQLILNSYGTALCVENSIFCVETANGKQHIAPHELKSILISKSARITSDAVLLAIENGIDVLFIDRGGQPVGRVWSHRFGSISDIRKGQLEFLYSQKAIAWIVDLVTEKINKQIALLLAKEPLFSVEDAPKLKLAINAMEDHKRKVRQLREGLLADMLPSLRGWEGACAKRYFQTINLLLPDSMRMKTRSAHPALDPFNAMLNYGYGMLYGKIEAALVKAGIDPYIGIFHRDQYNRPALVFDIIEKYRVWVDHVIIELARQKALPDDAFHTENDSVWLEGIGKRIVIQSINDYLDEVIALDGIERSRQTHIEWHAHKLAEMFLKFSH